MGLMHFKELTELPDLFIDLRYQTQNNFMGETLYSPNFRAQLHKEAYDKLSMAIQKLKTRAPDTRLLILDVLRPRSVQRKLYQFVENTPQQDYVANPDRGSVHNFGMAVDLTLADSQGRELDMGTPFDDFSDLAQPQKEDEFFQRGLLTQEQLHNRHLLRDVMVESGFTTIPHEWWHFNALILKQLIDKNYPILETENG